MNGFLLTGYLLYGIYQLANYLKKKDALPEEDNSKPKYIINDKKTPINPLTRSYQILDFPKGMHLSPYIIHRALHKQLEFATEDRLLGYERKYSVRDYQAAKMYLLDYYKYVAYLN
jgi:hypothetical protein